MKEQSQKPIAFLVTQSDVAFGMRVYSQPQVDHCISHLESELNRARTNYQDVVEAAAGDVSRLRTENTALKERVAELEKGQSIIVAYCEVSIEALKGFEGDQSEYDGMYQAISDLREKIKGEMPWPDLVLDRINQ